MSLGEAVVEIGADTSKFRSQTEAGVQSALGRAGASMQNVGRKMTSVGRSMTLGVTAPLVAIGVAAVKTAGDFEQTMSVLQANSGASGKSISRLSGLAKQLGADTVFSANEAAQAMLELSKGGFSAAEIAGGGVQAVMALAAAEGMDLAQAATVVANNMNAFSISARNAGKVADYLAAGSAASTASVQSLAEGMSNVGGTARNFGMDMQETVGILAAFDANAIRGAEGGTALNSLLTKLSRPTKQAKAELDKYGISLVDQQGNFKDITQIAGEFERGLAGLSQAEKARAVTAIAGSYGQRALNALMKEGESGIRRYIKASGEQGAAQKLANARMDGMKGALEKMSGALETAGLSIGEVLAPMIVKVADVIGTLADKFTQLPSGAQKAIVVFGLIAAAVGPLLVMTGMAVTAIGSIAGALAGVSLAVAAPIAAFAAVAIAIGILLVKSETARAVLASTWGKVKDAVGPPLAELRDLFGRLGTAWRNLNSVGGGAFTNAIKALGEFAGGLVAKGLGLIFKGLVIAVKSAGNQMFSFAQANITVANIMVQKVGGAIAFIIDRIGDLARLTAKIDPSPFWDNLAAKADAAGANVRNYMADFDAGSKEMNATLRESQYLWNLTGKQAEEFGNKVLALPREVRTIIEQPGALNSIEIIKELQKSYNLTPDEIVTMLRADGAKLVMRDIGRLKRLYDLTPKQVTTLIKQAGVQGTVAQIRDFQRVLNLTPKRVITLLGQTGGKLTMREVRNLIDVYGKTPKKVVSLLKQTGAELTTRQVNALIGRYNLADKDRSAVLRAIDNATPVINRVLQAVRGLDGKVYTNTVVTQYRQTGGGRIPRAHGGPVFGPGTSTSDSIAAWLSTGEFVMRAAAVKKYGLATMHDLNAMRLANGGAVKTPGVATSSVATAAPGSQMPGKIILRVGSRDFVAYVEEVADTRISAADSLSWQGAV